jgi:hypothetical protein
MNRFLVAAATLAVGGTAAMPFTTAAAAGKSSHPIYCIPSHGHSQNNDAHCEKESGHHGGGKGGGGGKSKGGGSGKGGSGKGHHHKVHHRRKGHHHH